MRKLIVSAALASQLFAGGFYLQLGNPDASKEARKAGAILTIKATGCGEPEKAQITATAIGMMNGKRQEIPLKVAPLAEPGMFAVTEQWPKDGRWVIEVRGEEKINGNPVVTYTVAPAGPDGVNRYHAKSSYNKFQAADIDAMLK
jgi:hypothetical protein